MQVIVYTWNGDVHVIVPNEAARLAYADGEFAFDRPYRIEEIRPRKGELLLGESDDEFVARIAAQDVPAGASSVKIVNVSALPGDHSFRDAWKQSGAKVVVDMPKAREIHRSHLRVDRAPMLAALDIEYQRADETGDVEKKREIARRKQELRDVTADPAIEAAKTPDELKAVTITGQTPPTGRAR